MKGFTLALLAATVGAATSVGARADTLSDLKTQIETLNARVAGLEAAPSVPAGYAMISFSKVGDEHIISIMPTADAPAAAATTIAWSGYVRAALATERDTSRAAGNQYSTDIFTRAKLKVVGKTDTAVGEVGVQIEFKAVDNENFFATNAGQSLIRTDGYYGWWKMTPNLTLSAGLGNSVQKGTLAKSAYSFDAICSCYYNDSWGAVTNTPWRGPLSTSSNANPAQLALAYKDGPLGLALAVEDAGNIGDKSAVGVSGKASYSGDTFGADVSGGYWGHPTGNAAWGVSAGVGAKLAPVTLGAAIGTGNSGSYNGNYDFTVASAYATAKLGDAALLELGLAHDFGSATADKLSGATLFEGGIYYNPVKQLTVGLEGQYQSGGAADQSYLADLVTIFRF